MAQYRLSAQIIGRGTGRSATAAAAYRAGVSIADDHTGQVHDYSRRHGVLHREVMAPDNAPDWMRDRAQLWNAVEKAEKRGDAQLAREIQLSLPHELDDDQRRELVRSFVADQFVKGGMIADLAIHAPSQDGDERNHHAHVMLTLRELTGAGFGKKVRGWNDRDQLEQWREKWADAQNRALERHGVTVDHRSFDKQGVDREPTFHLGKSANDMERRGKESRISGQNAAIDERNAARSTVHAELARIKAQLAQVNSRFARQTSQQVAAANRSAELDALDLARRHDRQQAAAEIVLERQYGGHLRTLEAERAAVSSRLQTTGFRRVLRTVTGKARADRIRRAEIAATVSDIRQRQDEARAALLARQGQENTDLAQRQEKTAARIREQVSRQQGKATRELERRAALLKRQTAREGRADLVRTIRSEKIQTVARQRPTMEQQPVKPDFDKSRDPQKVRPAETEQRRVATPAPAPSPAGEVPRRHSQVVDVPKPTRAAQEPAKPAQTRADYWNKVAAPAPSKPQQTRDYWAENKREMTERKERPTPTRDRTRERDYDRDR